MPGEEGNLRTGLRTQTKKPGRRKKSKSAFSTNSPLFIKITPFSEISNNKAIFKKWIL